ncbi:potassium/sodium hyperpolarization-activated cyclic nucleotide-gated channel protein [Wolffia australiana]
MASSLGPPRLPLGAPRHGRRRRPATACAPASFEPSPEPNAAPAPPLAGLEPRRRASAISPERRRSAAVAPPEPPNRQIGWTRTKEISHEKPKGWIIADFVEKLEGLMARGRFGSAELLAKVGFIVAERAREEVAVVVEKGGVDERKVTELERVLKLLEMDMEMVKVAVREETLKERVEIARARCRQAILLALSL